MTVLTFILVGVICLAAGFVAGKLYTEKALNQANMQQQIEDSKREMIQYKEEVSSNLGATQKLMEDMKVNYDNLVKQMDHTTKLLEKPRVAAPTIPYFGFDATEQLLSTSTRREESKRRKESSESQPSDYSDGSSGLFNNKENNQDSEKVGS